MKNLGLLFRYAKGFFLWYVFAFACTLLSRICMASQPLLIRLCIDSVIGDEPVPQNLLASVLSSIAPLGKNIKSLFVIGGAVLAFVSFAAILDYLKIIFGNTATEGVVKKLRNTLYNHIQLLPFSAHVQGSTGNLMQRCTSDIDTVRMALSSQIVDAFSSFFFICYIVYLMFGLSKKLMLLSLCIIPIILLFALFFFKKIQKTFKAAADAEAVMTTVIQENLTGVRVVKSCTAQKFEIDKFDAKSSAYRDCNFQVNNAFALFWSISDFLSYAQVSFVVLYGSVLAFHAEISLGTLIAFISYMMLIIYPVRGLGRLISNIGKAAVSAKRIAEVLDMPIESLFPTGEKPEIKGNINFDSVSFSYPQNKALDSVSFEIRAGETIGIMGPTGSGKSSLVHILTGLYDIDSGSILIDGIPIQKIDKGFLRSQIGIVLQEPFLYAKTIMENIKFALPEAPDELAIRYAKLASLHDEVMQFDDSYKTLVGERGVSLSGGQKQRLAIARTLIKNSPVIIFDDSLSAVDTETEHSIQQALSEFQGKKTIIIISHRISTVSSADKIIVLQKGKIVEQGSHQQLLAENGLYKRMYDIQVKIETDEAENKTE
ncbi:ABC transporter ATP-binding protein [Treponema phagedenis]|uniref:ABC transporter ATP-binding protein n=1 Tax=Treponema phagedenis TaxID=162 RepID=UPI000466FCFB|nr:ABC transporter ATP-binding protein [Treponema phagedenis]NVP23091.1 ABC transporter ATP-binding protein [Treponema phagedenis]QEK00947.1 ABC transporter ATP-binding protein [Treponema phagedenis]QEK05958.1 ABC transporter ATP-binding protein [Treponema phagedenis]QKS92283.1 ABC transporter ATP-binding protein [Treponema phagedenis]QLC57959.1 ABC transporter ATP-binding protein [Treponema phagedenis]